MDKSNFFIENVTSFNNNIKKYTNGRYIYCWGSMIWCGLIFGASHNDFFRYKFFEKSNYERKNFITYRKSKKIIKTCNEAEKLYSLENKSLFNSRFKDFIKRDWIDMSVCTIKDFELFVIKNKVIVIKPMSGSKGLGIFKYKYKELDDLEVILQKNRDCIAEEIIIQHEILSEINSNSVNTIRVQSFLDGNDVHIIGCTLRVGASNSFVDNLSSGGVAASVDLKSGIICTPAKNKELESFMYHPLTNVQIIGTKIPNWDMVIESIKEAAKLIPEIRYIGWDVAILPEGIEIIEANHNPGHRTIQMFDQIGKYELIEKCF